VPLSQPPRNGLVVQPHDHPDILSADDLIRRISEEQVVTVGGVRRISSIAFQPSGSDGGMSVDIKKSIEEAGTVVVHFVTTPRWIGSVVFKAGIPRAQGLLVGYDPLPDNPHHGEIWGKHPVTTAWRSTQAA
jgi:hypothetical protein